MGCGYPAFASDGGCAQLDRLARTRFWELKTASESAPLPESHLTPASDCEIGWLVDLINAGDGSVEFGVDRTDAARCRTPRRNPEIEAALSCLGDLGACARLLPRRRTPPPSPPQL